MSHASDGVRWREGGSGRELAALLHVTCLPCSGILRVTICASMMCANGGGSRKPRLSPCQMSGVWYTGQVRRPVIEAQVVNTFTGEVGLELLVEG